MPTPRTEAEMKAAAEVILNAPPDWYKTTYTTSWMLDALKGPQDIPKLRGPLYRLWCGLKGHGKLANYPGNRFYLREGFCKKCGARVVY